MELRKDHAHKKIPMPLLISSFDATVRVKRVFHPVPASRGFASHVFLVIIIIIIIIIITTTTNPDRHSSYGKGRNSDADSFNKGGYRFQSSFYKRMKDSCTRRCRCSPYPPGWLNGASPSLKNGFVARLVCILARITAVPVMLIV